MSLCRVVYYCIILVYCVNSDSSFLSNSIIGKPIECSDEEKLCYRFNLLYNEPDGKCYNLLTKCDDWTQLSVSRSIFNTTNRFFATCKYNDCLETEVSIFKCSNNESDVEEKRNLCGDVGVEVNMFGELECQCSPTECAPPMTNSQPTESRKCIIPNVWKGSSQLQDVYTLQDTPCTEEEFECYKQKKILHNGKCEKILEQGPCEDGYRVVVHYETFIHNHTLVSICSSRPCNSDAEVYVKTKEMCLRKENVGKQLCVNTVGENIFGYATCYPDELPDERMNGICGFQQRNTASAAIGVAAQSNCATKDSGQCSQGVSETNSGPLIIHQEE